MNWKALFILLFSETALFMFSMSWALWATQILDQIQGPVASDFEVNAPKFATFFLQFLRITYILIAMLSLYSVPFYYQIAVAPESQRANDPKGYARSFSMILILVLEISRVLLFFTSAMVLVFGGLESFAVIDFFTKAYLITSVIILILGGMAYKITESLSSRNNNLSPTTEFENFQL